MSCYCFASILRVFLSFFLRKTSFVLPTLSVWGGFLGHILRSDFWRVFFGASFCRQDLELEAVLRSLVSHAMCLLFSLLSSLLSARVGLGSAFCLLLPFCRFHLVLSRPVLSLFMPFFSFSLLFLFFFFLFLSFSFFFFLFLSFSLRVLFLSFSDLFLSFSRGFFFLSFSGSFFFLFSFLWYD